jgi:hypothetical protein
LTKGDLRMLLAMERDFRFIDDLHKYIEGIFVHLIMVSVLSELETFNQSNSRGNFEFKLKRQRRKFN